MSWAYRTAEDRLEIPKGNVKGHSVINKFGSNANSAQNTIEDVWDGGGTYPWATSATITHVSQSVNDATMLGETIEVQGLNDSWDLVLQTVTLDGTDTTTLQALTTPLRRVFRVKVLADVVAAENVVVTNAAGSTTYAQIIAGNNQTLMALYTVPRNCTAYITSYYYGYVRTVALDPTSVEFGLWVADRGNGYEFQIKNQKGLPHGS